ncbi:MAG TPA: prenyltransferase/squalene oxidase repeat-containing protein [Chthoniobacteraceae bacterium]|jgi:hypothetical protein
MDSSPKPLVTRIQEKLAASRFFTFSALLHVVLVIMGGSVVLFKQYVEPPDFVSEGGGLVTGEVSVQPPTEQPPDMTEQAFTPEQPSITAPALDSITTMGANSSFTMAAPPPVRTLATNANAAMTNVSANLSKGVATGLPASMAGRAGGQRATVAAKAGGKEKSEKAVMAGLRWLKQNQNEDGSWSKTQHKPAMTGLAILCFLGHGELPESPEFGPTVKKGIDWLLARGTEFEGRMSLTKEGWGGHHGVYEHGIATYALSEYYTMTKDERVAELLKLAVGHIVTGQAPDGGWHYSFAKKPDSDTSVSGWQIQALKAAHLSGLGIPGVDEALDKAMVNLKRVQTPNGNFHYTKPGDRGEYPGLVGVGVLCTYFWKQDRGDKVVRQGIDFMLDRKHGDLDYKGDNSDLYAWYYNTQAALMYGGSAWTKWNRMFQDQVADNQSPDGSWPPVLAKGAHGAALLQKADDEGPIYRTTLCVLMLEVFYRYMPTTKG